ncbi:MAG TPA: ABC transporter substrate-binding protein [Xanthobacteraceae bacterium]|nr:ABC transporter substrate-binding protein [Xanthobacteraceae bacterium]
MRGLALAGTMLAAVCGGAQAADQIKLGLITPLSGPISPAGAETKRGVDLALEELGNKLGGLPVKYTVVDDKTNPAEAVQGASKLIDDAKVDFVTGFSSSNTMIPVWKTFNDAGVFAIGALAGPLQFAGKDCVQNGFVVSFSNDDWPAAVGKYMSDKGVKSAFFVGADYQAGYEHVGAAMKYFKGKAVGPVYTPLTQLDFAPEMARIRAEKPDAVFAFLVGAGGVAFVKQYAQAGLQNQIPFYTEDPVANPLTFPAQGDAAVGLIMGTNWTADLDNPANKKFVAAFTAKYNRLPATFAALGYDSVKLIDSAVKEVGGKIENKDAVRAALRKANFQSVRGSFKFNNNHYPIQNLYIMEVKKDEKGNLRAVLKDTAVKDWQDPYHQECPMKW